ncbi:hypothetical protein GCM10010329_47210 [Streptomyces spiroverticillatus]|uniref:Uncharacterized protein n=1 Tax=Streptomyces finlayi TaxID=67296 RepID=A0A918X059_9ACTN|nr:hypothetical protein [Streptomyces finlayi]GHA18604.1 hypothetical protein GCM10010329_47210 [Streptomyces spiroverticillatus]GHD00106.1 hypothetical protein GCM10010334_44380 [Streptomyces finlayi]
MRQDERPGGDVDWAGKRPGDDVDWSGKRPGDDVDWAGEWRWHDAPWAGNAAILLGFCAVSGLGWLSGTRTGVRISVLAVAAAGLLILFNALALKRLRRETGLDHRRLAAVMRLSRREEIPADPVARRAMFHLVRLQNSKRAGGRWMRPACAVLMLLVAVVQLLAGNLALGAGLLLAAAYLASRFSVVARLQARLDRLEARLAPEFAAGRAPGQPE